MADNLSNRSASAFSEGDPFAELSRIMGGPRHAPQAQPVEEDDGFELDLEREMLGEFEQAAPRFDDGAASYIAPSVAPRPVAASYASSDEDFAAAFEAELGLVGQSVPVAEREEIETVDEAVSDDLVMADVDMDFGDLDFSDQPESAAAPVQSLEDELTAMLTGAAPVVAAVAVPAFGRANFSHDTRSSEPVHVAETSVYSDEDALQDVGQPVDFSAAAFTDEDVFGGGHEGHTTHAYADGQSQEADTHFENDRSVSDDLALIDDFDFDTELNGAFAQGSQSAAVSDTPAGFDEQIFEIEEAAPLAAEAAFDPFSVFSTIVPETAKPVVQMQPSSSYAPMQPMPQQPADMFSGLDDFATVSVSEGSVPTQDDLDLPDLDYDDSANRLAVDYEAEAADAFGDFGLRGTSDQPMTHSPQPVTRGYEDDDAFAEAIGMTAASVAAYSGVKARAGNGGAASQFEDLDRMDDLVGEGDAAEAAYRAPYREPAKERRGNGRLIAALAIGAVVVLGAAGVFALTSGGGNDSATPALVKADPDPIKVKPENPGGNTVANTESTAYQRVANGQTGAAPAQGKLVTAAEEPVNLAAREAQSNANALPGVDKAPVRPTGGDATAKGEDRLAVQAAPEGVGAEDDLAAVQPRRVRTMVVKPDGTLVPREEPASVPAPQNTPRTAVANPPAQVQTPPAATVATPAANAVREVANRTTTVAPGPVAQPQAAAPAIPTERPTPPPAAAAQPAPAQQQVAQAAPSAARNAPVAAPAGASEWSMQIASQPTAEGAQSAYQDLARRYGSVLAGQGVNIVRADLPGKGTYYRVRIPSSTRSDAVALCEKYKAAGGSCFVSK